MDYKDYNDNELLMYISENDETATDIMYKKYEPVINQYALKLKSIAKRNNVDIKDLIQEGMIGLKVAVEHFAEQSETSFYTFAVTCIKRRMINLFNESISRKNEILNYALSFDTVDDVKINFENIVDINKYTTEEKVMDKIDTENLIKRILKNLSGIEKDVFRLRLDGFTYIQIGKMLNKNYKSIDNAIQRIRTKAKIILDNYRN